MLRWFVILNFFQKVLFSAQSSEIHVHPNPTKTKWRKWPTGILKKTLASSLVLALAYISPLQPKQIKRSHRDAKSLVKITSRGLQPVPEIFFFFLISFSQLGIKIWYSTRSACLIASQLLTSLQCCFSAMPSLFLRKVHYFYVFLTRDFYIFLISILITQLFPSYIFEKITKKEK